MRVVKLRITKLIEQLKLRSFFVFIVPLAFILACNLSRPNYDPVSNHIVITNRLPTLTPTTNPVSSTISLAPTDVPTPPPSTIDVIASPINPAISPSSIPTVAPAQVPAGQPLPAPAEIADNPTAISPLPAAGWSFANVKFYPDETTNSVLLYGDIINNTGTTQELSNVTGTFYDAQGQAIAGEDNIFVYWPVEIVPPEAQLPFELIIMDGVNVADYELQVEAQPNERTPHQNFQVTNLNQRSEDGIYCLTGQLHNQGVALQEFMFLVAVMYDAEDHIVTFGEYYETDVVNDNQLADFEICVEISQQPITRYELRAWGL